ncbi:MAG TPA: Sec-independent protein translocase protein TatB [Croceibacterium sp.]|jgi:sec-independent protein translocase protein TatB|nr:Sec-independent protein translocase protein TatB [Croceibacterium sp.]
MFGIDWEELLVIVIVAVVVIGPKDMPVALRTAGRWIARVRRVSNHFRAGVEAMIREAEMEEMEKKWAAQNEKILREHPADAPVEMEPTGAYPARPAGPAGENEETAQAAPRQGDAEEPQLPFGKRK